MATGQQIYAFRSQYPEFDDVAEADIAISIDTASMWVDPQVWTPTDVNLAVQLLAAHFLSLKQQLLSSTQSTGISDLYVQSVAFGERRISFGQRRFEAAAEKMLGPGEQMLLSTFYGMQFIQLRARNIIPIAIV